MEPRSVETNLHLGADGAKHEVRELRNGCGMFKNAVVCAVTSLACAVSSTVAQQPIGAPGGAAVNIQLPTVNVVSVQTTVSAPDGGTAVLGGLSRSAAFRNQAFGQPTFTADAVGNGQVSAKATIIDHEAVDDQFALRVARGFLEQGGIAEAISHLQQRQQTSRSEAVRAACAEELRRLQRIGSAQFDALAAGKPTIASVQRAEQLLDQFGALIDSPQRRDKLRQWRQDPDVAEALYGETARGHLDKGIQAEAQGRSELAKIYYRMAARHPATNAGRQAAVSLEQSERIVADRAGSAVETWKANAAAPSSQPNYARLAHVYRGVDAAKSAAFLHRAKHADALGSKEQPSASSSGGMPTRRLD